jgi:MFS family permease
MISVARALPARLHYAWVVVGLAFLTLLITAAVRATPSVLIVPLEHAFGWSATTISLAISLNLVLYGALGPVGAALMQRFGIRRTVLAALAVIGTAVVLSGFMSAPWQLVLTWGLLVGSGCGTLAPVLGAVIVNRWFAARRGLALGIVMAGNAAGQIIFLPLLAAVVEGGAWRPAIWIVAGVIAAILAIVALFLPEWPADVGSAPLGEFGERPPAAAGVNPLVVAFSVLGRCVRSRNFWLLSASFLICGASSNGLVGTHLIPFCFDYGIPEVRAAGLLAAMGTFSIIGTTLSGWLSDRYDCRVLLMVFYGLRGLSLFFLPYSDFSFYTLSMFAVFYGLDWLATAPPMMRIITDTFGKADTPVVFGWLFVGHQIGAGGIAFLAGALRADLGSYLAPFLLSGMLCLVAAAAVLWIGTAPRGAGAAGLEPAQ